MLAVGCLLSFNYSVSDSSLLLRHTLARQLGRLYSLGQMVDRVRNTHTRIHNVCARASRCLPNPLLFASLLTLSLSLSRSVARTITLHSNLSCVFQRHRYIQVGEVPIANSDEAINSHCEISLAMVVGLRGDIEKSVDEILVCRDCVCTSVFSMQYREKKIRRKKYYQICIFFLIRNIRDSVGRQPTLN